MEPNLVTEVAIVLPACRVELGLTLLKHSLLQLAEHSLRGNKDAMRMLGMFAFARAGYPVKKVDSKGLAHKAGLRAMDVVVGLDRQDVTSLAVEEVLALIRQRSQRGLTISVLRVQPVQIEIHKRATESFGLTLFPLCLSKRKLAQGKAATDLENKCGYWQEGVPVQAVQPGSAAEIAGIQNWDVVVEVNGADLRAAAFEEVVKHFQRVGVEKLAVTIMRIRQPCLDVTRHTITVSRGAENGLFGFALGINMNSQISVLMVATNGSADRAGLKEYDVLEQIDGTPAPSPKKSKRPDLQGAKARIQRAEDTVTLVVARSASATLSVRGPATGPVATPNRGHLRSSGAPVFSPGRTPPRVPTPVRGLCPPSLIPATFVAGDSVRPRISAAVAMPLRDSFISHVLAGDVAQALAKRPDLAGLFVANPVDDEKKHLITAVFPSMGFAGFPECADDEQL